MANNIKGITIEIGGDTTKLDKALGGVNKNVKSTQAELRPQEYRSPGTKAAVTYKSRGRNQGKTGRSQNGRSPGGRTV